MRYWLSFLCALLAVPASANVPQQGVFPRSEHRLTNTSSPRGASTSVTFNHQGLPATAKDPRNPQASFYYDAKGRLTNRTDGVATTAYAHDANDNLTGVTEPGITNTWTFDAYNHVSSYKLDSEKFMRPSPVQRHQDIRSVWG